MRKKPLYQVSEIKLVYKSRINIEDRPKIRSSRDAYDVLLYNWSDQIEMVEEFNMLLLNRANRVIGIFNVSKGGHSGTVVDAKVIFSAALKSRSAYIILSHNHPSLEVRPSASDIALSKKLKKAGEFLDIPVLDHLIITPSAYYSFADEGMF